MLSAYVGADYLDVDQTVNGTTSLPDAFPDGDDLNVRYRIDQSNTDKWSGLVGMTFRPEKRHRRHSGSGIRRRQPPLYGVRLLPILELVGPTIGRRGD